MRSVTCPRCGATIGTTGSNLELLARAESAEQREAELRGRLERMIWIARRLESIGDHKRMLCDPQLPYDECDFDCVECLGAYYDDRALAAAGRTDTGKCEECAIEINTVADSADTEGDDA